MVPRALRYKRRMGGEHRGGWPARSEPRRLRGGSGRGRCTAAALAGRRVAESFPLAAEATHWETLSRTPDRPLQRDVRLRARHAQSEGAAGATGMYVESDICWLGWGSTTGRSSGCGERSRRRRFQLGARRGRYAAPTPPGARPPWDAAFALDAWGRPALS